MKSTARARTIMTELQEPVSVLEPLRQYLDLLQTSLDRYECLKESGSPDAILYVEKGLIEQQLQFLSKVFVSPRV